MKNIIIAILVVILVGAGGLLGSTMRNDISGVKKDLEIAHEIIDEKDIELEAQDAVIAKLEEDSSRKQQTAVDEREKRDKVFYATTAIALHAVMEESVDLGRFMFSTTSVPNEKDVDWLTLHISTSMNTVERICAPVDNYTNSTSQSFDDICSMIVKSYNRVLENVNNPQRTEFIKKIEHIDFSNDELDDWIGENL